MSQETATMFLNEISVVDHCFIDSEGNVIGGSFNPSFLVSGKIDPVENVVVDFSTIKKQLKGAIDDKSFGFDHKCWVIENFSNVVISNGEAGFVTSFDALEALPDDHLIQVDTAFASIIAPRNAFKFVRNPKKLAYDNENAGQWFCEYLNQLFPELTFDHNNNVNVHTFYDQKHHGVAYFRYAHGLKDSTSYGCQNIAHGHLSFIQVDATSASAEFLLHTIAQELNYTMFINKDNVVEETDEYVQMEYQSHSRGVFSARWFKNATRQNCIILPTETTIEFLVDFVKTKYLVELQKAGIRELYVSEGLSKGAMVTIEVA